MLFWPILHLVFELPLADQILNNFERAPAINDKGFATLACLDGESKLGPIGPVFHGVNVSKHILWLSPTEVLMALVGAPSHQPRLEEK
jgi:hypothetical protein